MIAALALLLALQAPAPLPSTDDVRQAVEDSLNARCSGTAEADACGANRASPEVRNVSCRSAGEDLAACRYESRTAGGAWRATETRFRFDIETQLWFVDENAR